MTYPSGWLLLFLVSTIFISNYVVFMGVLLIISAVLAYMQMFKR